MTPKIVVVGSINVDLVTHLERLPRPGETVSGGTFVQVHGGKGANQAVAAARLGADVSMVGMLGDDQFGVEARAALVAEGISVEHIGIGSEPTGIAQILVDSAGENMIAVAPGANVEVTPELVRDAFAEIDAEEATVLSVLEIPMGTICTAAEIAEERGWRFVLDPAPARPLHDELLSLCDVITPNEHEISQLGKSDAEAVLAAGVKVVVVTKGSSGVEVHRKGQAIHDQAAFPATATDTTGAGDSFSGALAVALTEGSTLEDAVRFAAAAAALSVRESGARGGMPRREAVQELLKAGTP